MAQKRAFNEGARHFKKNKKQKTSTASEGSNEEVLLTDIRALRSRHAATSTEEKSTLPEQWSEIELDITELSSTGDGLALRDDHAYVVPFTTPGDKVLAKVCTQFKEHSYTLTDFLKVVAPSQDRTETPKCRYFTQCSGCQFQQLPYAYQLAHKRRVVEKAYQNFSGLPAHAVPEVRETVGSPLQYGYRTKLTPHFDGPPSGRRDRRHGVKPSWPEVPPIGFMKKGTRKTMDIEDCPIGTSAVRHGMKRERKVVQETIQTYQRGATLLLRESTQRVTKDEAAQESENDDIVREDRGDTCYLKSCITDHKATSTEFIDDFRFDNPAGAFFQNNNSILPLVTKYIRDNILGTASVEGEVEGATPIENMIDAYCGSGFFTVTLSKMFRTSIGIDISAQSIDFAAKNAKLNNLPPDSTTFIAADANQLFGSVDTARFPPEKTVVVIDPPRKGCDEGFIRQLVGYGPERICYVSCNVHTQARDVGWLVGGLAHGDDQKDIPGLYEIESLRGFDFFPQTSHVEGVAFLKKKTAVAQEVVTGAETNGKEQ